MLASVVGANWRLLCGTLSLKSKFLLKLVSESVLVLLLAFTNCGVDVWLCLSVQMNRWKVTFEVTLRFISENKIQKYHRFNYLLKKNILKLKANVLFIKPSSWKLWLNFITKAVWSSSGRSLNRSLSTAFSEDLQQKRTFIIKVILNTLNIDF